MSFEGMDPDQVESLGRQLLHQESTLTGIVSQLDALTNSMATNWLGADSSRFHQTYTGQYRHQLTNAATQLGNLGNAAIRNASDQRQTSS
jgi:hypothetical protein